LFVEKIEVFLAVLEGRGSLYLRGLSEVDNLRIYERKKKGRKFKGKKKELSGLQR